MRRMTFVWVLLFLLATWAPVLPASVDDAQDPVAGREEAELGFDEAVELLRFSQAESRRILVDILGTVLELGLLGKDAEPDEMSRRIVEGVHGDVSAELQDNQQQIHRATRRILGEQDPDRLEAGLLAMSSEELAAVLAPFIFYSASQREQIEALYERSPSFRQRLMNELADETSELAQAVGEDFYNRLVSEGREEELESQGVSTVGARFLMPVLTLMPDDEVGPLVEDMINGRRYAHLAEDVENILLSSGLLGNMIEPPTDWVRERAEAGESFWLLVLAAEGDEADLPLLFEHIEALPMRRQVSLIAREPDPGFLTQLREAHAETMLAPMCRGCDGAPEFGELRELTLALVGMDVPETIELFDELLEAVPEKMQLPLARAATARAGDSDEGRALHLRLMQQYPELYLALTHVAAFDKLDPDGLDRAVEVRIESWVDELIGENGGAEPAIAQYCNALAMLLYARARDLFDSWDDLAETVLTTEDAAGHVRNCSHMLSRAVSEGATVQGVQALLDLWDASAAGAREYTWLVNGITKLEHPQREAIRRTLLTHLEGSETWLELSETQRNRLLGKR